MAAGLDPQQRNRRAAHPRTYATGQGSDAFTMHALTRHAMQCAKPAVFTVLVCLTLGWSVASVADQSDTSSTGSQAQSLDPDAADERAKAYYSELAMMLGRLEAAYSLYRTGDRDGGLEQLLAAAKIHLPVVRDALVARDLELLVRRIENLSDTAESSGSWIDVQDMYEASRMSLQRAMVEVEPDTRDDPAFKAEVVLTVAREAVLQYEQAVSDGEFVKPRAYHVGYGYMIHGRSLVERNAGLLGQVDDEVHELFIERYEAVMEAWPSVQPPLEPEVDVETLRERLAALESVVDRF